MVPQRRALGTPIGVQIPTATNGPSVPVKLPVFIRGGVPVLAGGIVLGARYGAIAGGSGVTDVEVVVRCQLLQPSTAIVFRRGAFEGGLDGRPKQTMGQRCLAMGHHRH